MIDREKVIKGLQHCFATANCDGCPYEIECQKISFKTPENHCPILDDVLDLLKEQDSCENCAIAIEDRQPVVRCKECKYWRQLYGNRPFYSSIGCCDCNDMWLSLNGETTEVNDIRTDSDFYCGYAVRR